jgi:hypothetical protein
VNLLFIFEKMRNSSFPILFAGGIFLLMVIGGAFGMRKQGLELGMELEQ